VHQPRGSTRGKSNLAPVIKYGANPTSWDFWLEAIAMPALGKWETSIRREEALAERDDERFPV